MKRWTLTSLALEVLDQEWRTRAACRFTPYPDVFHEDAHAARRICRECPVRAECLAYALAVDDRWGIWGGMSYTKRKRLGSVA